MLWNRCITWYLFCSILSRCSLGFLLYSSYTTIMFYSFISIILLTCVLFLCFFLFIFFEFCFPYCAAHVVCSILCAFKFTSLSKMFLFHFVLIISWPLSGHFFIVSYYLDIISVLPCFQFCGAFVAFLFLFLYLCIYLFNLTYFLKLHPS